MNNEQISYAQLSKRIATVARALLDVASPGERIAVLSWNSVAFVELLYAVPAAGMILVPINVRLAPAEWRYQLEQCGATLLLAQDTFLEHLHSDEANQIPRVISLDTQYPAWRSGRPSTRTLPTLSKHDPAWLLYTSGSTGKPKGAVLSHQSLLAGLESARIGRPVEPTDIYFYPFPLFHVAAHNVLLQHAFGATVLLSAAFNAKDTLNAIRHEGVTTLSLAPTMIAMLLDEPDFTPEDLQGVRTIGYGASAMPLSLLERLQAVSCVGLCQSYGMTELCGSVAFLTVADHQRALGGEAALLRSVGKPLTTATVRIENHKGETAAVGEPGEIVVEAPQCFSHYWNNAQATELAITEGWLHTGDIGYFDAHGYLFIVDRKKDMIITGGENVASREVEEALRTHEAVKECAVIGLPDPRWGERVTAVVVLNAPTSDHALEAHCRSLLAGYKTPKTWHRVERLPINAGGKIDKPALREQFETEPQPPAN